MPVAYSDNDDAPSSNLMNKHKQEDSTPMIVAKANEQTKQLVPAITKTESVKIPVRMQMMDRVMMVEKVLNIPRVSLVLIARITVFVKARRIIAVAAKAVAKGENQQQQQQQSRSAPY